MNRLFSKGIWLLLIITISTLSAQEKSISLDDINEGVFRAEYLSALRSMNNGKEYSVYNYDRKSKNSTIDVYDYKTGDKVRTLLNTAEIEGIDYIISYQFSDDETKLLLATKLKQIYRRSSVGIYYVYDLNLKELTLVSDHQIQEPTFNGDSSKLAYGYNNNLFVKDLNSGETKQLTSDGKVNRIINGITDWVYEEEFSVVRAFDWNISGDKIAFIRFDETEVPEFLMDIMGNELYPTQQVFKYPKAGEKNAEVSLHIYDLKTDQISQVDLSGFNNYYIPRIKWTKDSSLLSVQLLNRPQNKLDLILVDVSNKNTTSLLHQESDDAYVSVNDDLTFLKNNKFIWTSEKSGWNHIYLYDENGKNEQQITSGSWEVTSYYGFDENTGLLFYNSTQNGSINRDVYSVSLKGKKTKRLTLKTGFNNASFSKDFSYFINTYSSATIPYTYTLNESKNGKVVREVKNNKDLVNKLKEYKISPKEYSTLLINGNLLNMYTLKPLNFDETKKYPLFLYQYSGPGSQSVSNQWIGGNDYWHQMLVQDGIIVVCVDGRGTGFKGRDFKKMTQLELGKYEVEDQIAVAKKLGELPYVDSSRIGIWGWSYGGFMSSNCLFQASDIFSMAIAVAPVSSWRFYDTIYTERYMHTPQENPLGYDLNSPITYADKLEGDFLLIHGAADDNVHLQNTLRLSEALIQADKDFEWAIYPDKNHSIYGGKTRSHLYKKMTKFVKESLGDSETNPKNLQIN
ncbi:MAG: S9 family peptidase [Flavobacteriaceae bacterium]|nr:S9 family peptidase [Flavobacteriaceae bacterium]